MQFFQLNSPEDVILDANLLNQCFKYHFRQLEILKIINFDQFFHLVGAGQATHTSSKEYNANLVSRAIALFYNMHLFQLSHYTPKILSLFLRF